MMAVHINHEICPDDFVHQLNHFESDVAAVDFDADISSKRYS